jgi:hypothetical protein
MGCYTLDLGGSGQGLEKGSCEHGNETSGSIKCWEMAERLAASQERPSSVDLIS